MSVSIRPFRRGDWSAVATIYGQGLAGGNATFETKVPDYNTFTGKFHSHLFWVAVEKDVVVGWAGLQPVSAREVYKGVTEVTIYVGIDHAGSGIGTLLMKHLIHESELAGIWTLYASIFPENTTSIKLHEAAGFRRIGYREKIAQLHGKWRDTILFEKRSIRTGG
jgi:L-amino acid N-acyltransferase YncA